LCRRIAEEEPSLEDDGEVDNKPVWPTWAIGALSGVRDVFTENVYNKPEPGLNPFGGEEWDGH